MKDLVKFFILVMIISVIAIGLVACGEKAEEPANVNNNEVEVNNTEAVVNDVVEEYEDEEEIDLASLPKSEQIGTAGSQMPLKDRYDDAKYEIEVAFQKYLADTYGDKVFDARIYVQKIYSAEDEAEIEALGPDEIAFDVMYELRPSEGADINELTVANGEYEEDTGWIKNKFNSGIIRPSDDGEFKYVVTDLCTAW